MKALILNGMVRDTPTSNAVVEQLRTLLADRHFQVEEDRLAALPLRFCNGCFGCWLVSPGECVRRDDAGRCAARAIGSHVTVLLSPVTFGGFSSPLKKVIDRMIAIMMPEFEKMGRYSHHLPRYERTPALLGIGICDEPRPDWERTFVAHIDRLSVDMQVPANAALAVAEGADPGSLETRIARAIAKVEMTP